MVNRGQIVADNIARATYAAVLTTSLEDRRSLLAYLLSLAYSHDDNWMVAAMAAPVIRMVRVAGSEVKRPEIDRRTMRQSGYLSRQAAK